MCCANTGSTNLGGGQPRDSQPEETAEASSCGTDKVARFIGAVAVPLLRKAIESAAGHAPVRWIAPGQPVTLDFNPARLNIILDERNEIAAMRCG
ncbi:I78 family peptidase inhibitor [Novosphingobium sp. Chol11]|uniref:I78 family peptidase inhibitor n=1 Tax=Novosphingobium sp. Chol11 TaxID=1385763 RepID=UPI0025F9610E|nr:I78 family peptidase inhibitor [Novosphingobium sp. Chol11]